MTKQPGRDHIRLQTRAARWGYLGLLLILVVYFGLAFFHSIVVPLTQGEDELAHFRYISFIEQQGRLPVNQIEREEAWYRADWPPLYHLFVGGLVMPLDTSRPHLKDVGEAPQRRLVGEIYYPRLIVYTEDVNWPWQDAILAWHLGRFMSILFTTGALIITYFTVRHFGIYIGQVGGRLPLSIPPDLLAVGVTGLLAFSPRFVFTSAMLGDDSLLILLSAVFIYLLLQALYGDDRWRVYAFLGLLLGLSISTKYSTGLLALVIIPVVWWRAHANGWRWSQTAGRLLWSWVFAILGAGWWFGWIAYHFNTIKQDGLLPGLLSPVLASGPDVSMRRVFALFGGDKFSGPLRPEAIGEGSFWEWMNYLFQTFWTVPVLETDIWFPVVHVLLLVFVVASMAGVWHYYRCLPLQGRRVLLLLLSVILLLIPFPLLRFFLTYNVLETGQGRHILFPAAQTIPLLLLLGWLQFNQWVGVSERRSTFFALGPGLVLLAGTVFQLGYMVRHYPDPLPVQTSTFDFTSIPQPLKHDFGDTVRLLGYDFQPDPGQSIINLTLYWQAKAQSEENYRVQVRLVDPEGASHFTWLSHPLNGTYPTRAWDVGDVIRDSLPLPLGGVPPGTYQIEINLLHQARVDSITSDPLNIVQFDLPQQPPIPGAMHFDDTIEYRLWADDQPARQRQTIALSWAGDVENPAWTLTGPNGESLSPVVTGDATAIFIVEGTWPSGDYSLSLAGGATTTETVLQVANDIRQFSPQEEPHVPVEANFGNQIELLGYTLPVRRIEAGGLLPISLLWKSLSPVLPDALTFAVLLDANQQPVGQVDRYPAGFYSPILWVPGEVVADDFGLPVVADAPPGVYYIHLGQYRLVEGQPQSLPLVNDGEETDKTAVVIGPIKVGGPPPDLVVDDPRPQYPVGQSFGPELSLLGYDLSLAEPTMAQFTFYWEVQARPRTDYTTFLHLRDTDNRTVAQKDQPPAGGGYPTSLWEPGEIVVDEVILPVDQLPPGEYTPVIGLYEYASGMRLPVAGQPADEVPLQPIEVGD